MATWTFACWSCRQPTAMEDKVGRADSCPQCGTDMRSCRNCRFYDSGAHNACRESTAELVADKERANFCGMFEPYAGERAAGPDVDAAKAKLEALFSK